MVYFYFWVVILLLCIYGILANLSNPPIILALIFFSIIPIFVLWHDFYFYPKARRNRSDHNNKKIQADELEENKAKDSLNNSKENFPSNKSKVFFGSGFFVSKTGHIITNYHVIEDASLVKIQYDGKVLHGKILSKDSENDLALIKIEEDPEFVLAFSNDTSFLGQEILTAGYPLIHDIGKNLKVTSGVVSSLSGLQNHSMVQIDAPIHSGNSGGPVFDDKGNVIGVSRCGIPSLQNMNFAIKASIVKNFLEASGILLVKPKSRKINQRKFSHEILKSVVLIQSET